MKLNKNGLSAKLYSFIYNSELPINLCPYFWKLVIASVLFTPILIISLPTIIYNSLEKDEYKKIEDKLDEFTFSIGFYLVFGFILLFIWLNYNIIKMFLNCNSYNYKDALFGMCIDLLILLIITVFIIMNKVTEYKYYRPYKEKQDNILLSFIKAKYNNYCPKIDWKE